MVGCWMSGLGRGRGTGVHGVLKIAAGFLKDFYFGNRQRLFCDGRIECFWERSVQPFWIFSFRTAFFSALALASILTWRLSK